MSSKQDCHINPLTGRAIKTSGTVYKKLMDKEKKTTKIQALIKSKKAQSDLNEKKEAVNKLKAVVKRSTTKPVAKPKEPNTMYKEAIGPNKNVKPDYTKDGYFENVSDLENYFKSLVNLKPELKELYKKHKLDIGVFTEKLNKTDKRIPPTVKLFNSLYGPRGIDILVEIFKTKKPIRRGR